MKKLFTLLFVLLATVGVKAQRTTLWESDKAEGQLITWSGDGLIFIYNFEPVAGDVLAVTVTKVDKSIDAWPQAKLMTPVGDGWEWTALTDPVQMQEAGEYQYEITADMLENIASHKQVFFSGTAAYISKVELIPSADAPQTVELSLSDLTIGWGGTSYEPVDGVCTIDTDHNVIGWSKSVDKTKYSKFVLELANVEKNGYFQVVFNGNESDKGFSLESGSYVKVIDLSYLTANIDRVKFQGMANTKFTIKQAYFATAEYVTENDIKDQVFYDDTKDLGLGDLNAGWNASYDSNTKTITVDNEVAAGGKGWWYGTEPGADFSHFDNLVIEFEPTTSEGNVEVQYNGAENKKVNFYLGATCVVIPLDATGKSDVKCIQIAGGANDTFTLKAAYVAVSSKTPEEALGTTYTVAGAETILGSSWDINDTNNTLTFDGTNYTLKKTEVTLEKNVAYGFKVVKNHSWSPINYGKDGESGEDPANATLTVDATAVYTVTFTFNPETPTLTATVEKTGDAEEQEHEWSVRGDFNGDTTWSNEYEMTKGEDGKFTVSIPVTSDGDVEFKVTADHAWAISYPASNYKIEGVEAGSTVVITFDPETHEVTATVTSASGISALTIEDSQNAPMYNLAGQRVDKEYKGVVIQNGKKLLVK